MKAKHFLATALVTSLFSTNIFAADSAGISGTVITLAVAEDTQMVTLSKDWNLLGINANLTLEELKSKIGADNLLIIQGPNSTYKKSYADAGLNNLNTFKKVEDTKGYWIKVATAKTLQVPKVTKAITIPLNTGWNLINPTKPLTLAQINGQVGADNLLIIQGPNSTYKKSYADAGLNNLNDFTYFSEPEGYWIKVAHDATLTFQ